jgi:hypothetical protein
MKSTKMKNRIVPLGVHVYNRVNVTKQMLRGGLFAIGDIKSTLQQPCAIVRFSNAEAVPLGAEAEKIKRLKAQIEGYQNTVIGLEYFGLFGLYKIPKGKTIVQLTRRPEEVLSDEKLSALHFFYPRGTEFFILAYTYWGPQNFMLHSTLAHACQSYFILGEETFGNSTQAWFTGKFLDKETGELSKQAAVSFVMGHTRKQARNRLKALEQSILYPDQLDLFRKFERNVFESNPDNRGLMNVLENPLSKNQVKIRKFRGQRFIEPGRRQERELWGIQLNPFQAYLYLNRFMLAMIIALPESFEIDSPFPMGSTWLELDSSGRVISMKRYIEDIYGNKFSKLLFEIS